MGGLLTCETWRPGRTASSGLKEIFYGEDSETTFESMITADGSQYGNHEKRSDGPGDPTRTTAGSK